MKPPRRVRLDTTAGQDPQGSQILAVNAGRLVALLRGEGLTRGTVLELLRPESAAKLHAVLNKRPPSGREDRDAGAESQPSRLQPEDGKVLVFKAKETLTP